VVLRVRRPPVLTDQSGDGPAADTTSISIVDCGWLGHPARWSVLSGLIRAVLVVVIAILGQQRKRMCLVVHEHMIEEFATQYSDNPLADRIRPRGAHRRLDDVGAERGEHVIERCGESRVAVTDDKPQSLTWVPQMCLKKST